MAACLYGRTEAGRLLLNKWADPNLRNSDGATALIMASFFGHPELVRLLLEKGADDKIKNGNGENLLRRFGRLIHCVAPSVRGS